MNCLTKNKLVIYLIFNENFNEKISIKIKNSLNVENGRTIMQINEKEGNAHFFDFIFDEKTNIENNSTLIIE